MHSSVKQKAYTSCQRCEGAIGEDLDLRELQQSGRIGRIRVDLHSESGKSHGTITIPCSLDRTETAILAAAMETVDRVGPCAAKITLERLEDVREAKRRRIIDRAVHLLRDWEGEVSPDSQEMTDTVLKESRTADIIKLGKEELPAGPDAKSSDSVIIVEGRADVLALLRSGVKNAIAVEGTSIPKSIIELTKDKTVIAFLDGDRGGDLILRELAQVAKVDFVARAPTGREVEELTHKEVSKALRNKVPAEEILKKSKRKSTTTKASAKTKRRSRTTSVKTKDARRSTARVSKGTSSRTKQPSTVAKPKDFGLSENILEQAKKIQQTMTAVILDEKFKPIKETHVGEVANDLQALKKGSTLLL
ncbi:MAG: DNA primase DnaG, partial [Candidatus Hermodarchaeota archaeon]|nr:DNA primase DnaG [Candidatus Hermodarchaeota archaeon]